MLSNEKYKGDALLQKTYTVDFLTKKRVENNGEVPQYYVEVSHPAIIDKEMWGAVQLEMDRRKAFAGRVICGNCGSTFGRKVWNSNNERLRRIIWRCNKKYTIKGEKGCENKHIDDRVLYQAFVSTYNALVENKDYFLEKWKEGLNSENALARYRAKQFIKIIKNAKRITEFDVDMFFRIVEKIKVLEGKKIIITLLDGTDIECDIE